MAVQQGSDLADDDAKTNPYQVSHVAWQALTVASDHLNALRRSLVGDQRGDHITVTLHPYAQATLLRGAFENGARAVWLLAPGKRLTRITRRLALQADNNKHSDRMHELLGTTPPRPTAERAKQIRDLAVGAGIPPSDVKKELAFGYTKMVQTAGRALGGLGGSRPAGGEWGGTRPWERPERGRGGVHAPRPLVGQRLRRSSRRLWALDLTSSSVPSRRRRPRAPRTLSFMAALGRIDA
ncbi:hypothetical protein GR925_22300 [Streptomyces sp. HUCO-GS316]|uniref:hypothetical protein n=1 Tax=Streptomyces sp. HUCO-GS316 TaxID=2692198 RepID=UPI0013685A7C|nr:hypothetical protein [Streptomyces sp. HUCO-GS316]MXM66105.1 hypothetical protein [Streptomyces sp. HUCO-GS316]